MKASKKVTSAAVVLGLTGLGISGAAVASHVQLTNIIATGNFYDPNGNHILDAGESWDYERVVSKHVIGGPDFSFEDYYNFDLGADAVLNSAVIFKIGSFSNISGGSWELRAGYAGFDAPTDSAVFGPLACMTCSGSVTPTTPVVDNLISGLAPGKYVYVIKGDITGSDNGRYFAGLTGVPIPAAAWLFGAGLVGLAAVARRRVSGGEVEGLNALSA